MLDVYLLPEEESLQLPNTEVGVQTLVEQLQPLTPTLVVAESTGGLERLLVSGLQAASIPIAIAKPRKVKGFAIALGKAKTDKLDATTNCDRNSFAIIINNARNKENYLLLLLITQSLIPNTYL